MIKGLNSVLGEMEGIYNGIDVRVAAFRRDRQSHWQSYITVIRYSYLPKEEISRQQKIIQGKSILDQPEKFMMNYKAFSIDEQILERQGDGTSILKLSDITKVYYWKHRDPSEVQFNYSPIPDFQCDGWGALDGRVEENPSGVSRDGTMGEVSEFENIFHNEKSDAIKLGFTGVRKALKYHLQTINEHSWEHPMVYYVLPIYAKMSKPYYEDGKFWVDVERHRLSDLVVTYTRGTRRKYETGNSWGIDAILFHDSFEMQKEDKNNIFVKERVGLENYKPDVLENVPDEIIAVSLGCPRLNTVVGNEEHNRVRELLAVGLRQIVNPLLASFGLFCPEEDFKEMLLTPDKFRKTGKEGEIKLARQKAFERAVAWLLELGGYRTIWLGEKDTGFERGSADILAFNVESRRLYVIGCTTRLPKQDDMLSISTTCDEINVEVFGEIYSKSPYTDRKVELISTYFYVSKTEKVISELAREKGVLALSTIVIETMYEDLKQKGSIRDLKEYENYMYMQGEAI